MKFLYPLAFVSLISLPTVAQQSVAIGDTQTKVNAVLYLKGNGTQGLIIPIVSTNGAFGEEGMMVFNTTDNILYYHNGNTWVPASTPQQNVTLTAGQNISITGAFPNFTISAPSLVSSVGLTLPPIFNVTGSPVTSTGTLTATLATQTAGTVFAAPAAATGAPTFRSLTATDIPNLDASKLTTGALGVARGGTGVTAAPGNGQVLIGNGTGYALSTITAGTGINVTNGAGTISISATGGFTNPMTAPGDIIVGGAAGAPTRLGGTAGFLRSTGAAAPAWSAVNLASTDVTGTLPLTAGGTGATTATLARTNLGLGTLSTLNTITNAEVSATAAIAGTKINPVFGAQNILTTGFLGLNNATPAYPVDITTGVNGYGLNHTDGTVVLSTYTGSGGPYGGAIGTQSDHPFFIYTNNGGARLTVLNGTGDVGIGTFTPTSKLEVNGFTKLGSEVLSGTDYAPAIKVRKIVMTSPASQGGCVSTTLTVPASQIISVHAIMEYNTDNFIPEGYRFNDGFEFNWVINPSSSIQLCNVAGNSSAILSKPVIITITYEQ
jgi:hypothetical protein